MRVNLKSMSTTLILISILVLGCKLSNKTPQVSSPPNKNSAEPTKKPPARDTIAFKPSNNPQQDIADAMKRMQTAYPFRWTFSQTQGGRPTVEFIFEYEDQDRMHVRDSSGGEFVKMGSERFLKTTASYGEWIRDPTTPPNWAELTERDQMKVLLTPHSGLRFVGQETLNGVQCFVYQFRSGNAGIGKIWIGTDGLPYLQDESDKDFKQRSVFEYVEVDLRNPMQN